MYLFNEDDEESFMTKTGQTGFVGDGVGLTYQHTDSEKSDHIEGLGTSSNRNEEFYWQALKPGQIMKKRRELKSKATGRTPKRPKIRSAVDNDKKKISMVISIDFGSTHSGASFSTNQLSSQNTISTINDYPEANAEKIPSLIAYAEENQCWGRDQQQLTRDVIGYEVKPGMEAYHLTKLLLDDKADLTQHDDELLQTEIGASFLKLPLNRRAEDIVADYLRLFRKLIMEKLNQEFGEEFMSSVAIRYFVTTPALWDAVAIERTLEAVRKAGFNNKRATINTISEPIAGALAALVGMKGRSPTVLDEIKTCIVIDGGGGTVDLELLGIEHKTQLQVKELVAGEGGKCGATTIDRQFILLMQNKYGECFEAVEETEKGPSSIFMADFERAKRSFRGKSNGNFRINLPAMRDAVQTSNRNITGYDVRDGQVVLTPTEMSSLFAKTIKEICRLGDKLLNTLTNQQKHRFPDAILFVGGLANSAYIWERVFEHFRERCGNDMRILRPDKPWGAVSYGAVVYGLEKEVKVSRVARRHYGIEITQKFQEGIDDPERALMCPLHKKRAGQKARWLIQKSTELKEKNGTTLKHIRGYLAITDVRPQALQFSWNVFCCDEDKAPAYVDGQGVRVFAKLHIDLTKWKKGMTAKNPSVIHSISQGTPYKLKVNLYLSGGESAGNVAIRVNADQKNIGTYTLDYRGA